MATVIAPPKAPQTPQGPAGPPRRTGWGGGRGDGDAGRGFPDEAARSVRRYKTGMWMALCAVVMLFAAFTSAMVVRKGLSFDWMPIRLPSILWLNTAVLLASSFTIERAKRESGASRPWLAATSALGVIFLAGQYIAWRELAARGVYLASNPSSSFFYVLTGAHGLHLLGGVLALFYVAVKSWLRVNWVRRQAAIEATALYWHFMDGLWVYLFLLLQVGR